MIKLCLIGLFLFSVMGCSLNQDYAKLSNQRACGTDDCGKDPN